MPLRKIFKIGSISVTITQIPITLATIVDKRKQLIVQEPEIAIEDSNLGVWKVRIRIS